VAIEYLTALEGEFWCKIRGLGLAYSYHIFNSTDAGQLRFGLSRATDPVDAHRAAATIVQSYADGEATIGDVELESTKSSLIFSIVSGADTKSAATSQAYAHLFSGKEREYERELMAKVRILLVLLLVLLVLVLLLVLLFLLLLVLGLLLVLMLSLSGAGRDQGGDAERAAQVPRAAL